MSMKLITIIPGVRNLVERINEELPPEIRLWSIVSSRPVLYALVPNAGAAARTKFIQR